MIGTILNVAGILTGGIWGLIRRKPLSPATQFAFKAALGLSTIVCGLRLTWMSFNGSFGQVLKQFGVVMAALILGKLLGRLMHLQKGSNRLGQYARDRLAAIKPGSPGQFADGFQVCAVLFCAAPLGLLGATVEALTISGGSGPGYFYPLAVKAVMDGLAVMSFVSIFGWGVLFSAVPVLIFQGTLYLLCLRFLEPLLQAHKLIDPLNATIGLLIFCVALLIFEIKKVEVADYLPSLVLAPVFAWWLS